jgi:hypothetical protein
MNKVSAAMSATLFSLSSTPALSSLLLLPFQLKKRHFKPVTAIYPI